MPPQNVKISKLYYAVDGSTEPFELTFAAEDFEGLRLTGPVVASGELMRVEEGVMLLLQQLQATQTDHCAFCNKLIKEAVNFEPSEWLFYETKPQEDDGADELLFLDKKQMEIDPFEPVRQELMLNRNPVLHCAKPCVKFKEPSAPEPVKPLAGLKKLLKNGNNTHA